MKGDLESNSDSINESMILTFPQSLCSGFSQDGARSLTTRAGACPACFVMLLTIDDVAAEPNADMPNPALNSCMKGS